MIPVYSLLLVCVLPLPSAHEAAGALGIRHSPRPLWAEDSATARAHCAARSRMRVCRHCEERSDEAIHSFFARHDGLLRFARNDGTGCANARPMTGSAKQFIFLFV